MYHSSGNPERPIPSSIHVSFNNLFRAEDPRTRKTPPSRTPGSKKRAYFIENKFMDYAPYPIVLVDKSGQILQANPAFQRLLQLSPNELYGTFFLQWVAEEDREKTESAFFETRTAGTTKIFENGCCAHQRAPVRVRWSVRWDHTEKRLYCFGEQIKAERETEPAQGPAAGQEAGAGPDPGSYRSPEATHKLLEDLKLSNERYHLVAQATHDMIWDWDLERNEIFRNEEGLSSIYGFSNNDPIRRIDDWVERIHPEDRELVVQAIAAIHEAAPGSIFQVEYRFLKGDGHYVYIYDRGYIMRDVSGKPIRLIGAAQDITERVRLQHQLIEEKNARQKEIMEATIGVQEKERDQIGYELHDNVNQILTTAKLYLECIGLYDEQKETYRLMSEKLMNMGIEEIRRLSRSLVQPRLADVGLIQSIGDVLENIRITRQLAITLLHDGFDENKCEHGLQLAIYRIIQEQTNNILKYANASEIKIVLCVEDIDLVLSISDNGKGFTPSASRKGIGFTNITNRSAVYQGKVEIVSSPGAGCTLSVVFKQ